MRPQLARSASPGLSFLIWAPRNVPAFQPAWEPIKPRHRDPEATPALTAQPGTRGHGPGRPPGTRKRRVWTGEIKTSCFPSGKFLGTLLRTRLLLTETGPGEGAAWL